MRWKRTSNDKIFFRSSVSRTLRLQGSCSQSTSFQIGSFQIFESCNLIILVKVEDTDWFNVSPRNAVDDSHPHPKLHGATWYHVRGDHTRSSLSVQLQRRAERCGSINCKHSVWPTGTKRRTMASVSRIGSRSRRACQASLRLSCLAEQTTRRVIELPCG